MKVVLDTNVALDWLVFDAPSILELRQAIAKQHVQVIVNDLIVDELRRVLNYPQFKLGSEAQRLILNRYRSQSESIEMPAGYSRSTLLLPDLFPRCRDSDDDHFLAMTYHSRAQALVTKDKAILKLRKRAAKFGVRVAELSELNTMLGAMLGIETR